jgi:hypothetical protein
MKSNNLRKIIRKIILENQKVEIEPSLLKKIEIQLPTEYKKEGNIFPIKYVKTGQIINFKWSQNQLQQAHLNEDLKSNLTKGLVALCLVGSTLTSCDKVNDKLAQRNEISCVLKNGQEMKKIEYKLTYDILKKPKITNPTRNLEAFYYDNNGEILKGKITEVLPETVKINGLEISKNDIFSQPKIKPTYGSERKINMHFNRELSNDEINFIIKNSPNTIAQYVGGSEKSWETNPISDDEQIINVKVVIDYDMDKYYGDNCMNTGNLTQGFPDGRSDFFGVPIVK